MLAKVPGVTFNAPLRPPTRGLCLRGALKVMRPAELSDRIDTLVPGEYEKIRCGRPGFWGCPLGLIAVRVGRPMVWKASSMIEARWMASISLPIRCFSSDTGWDGDKRYPHTTRCYGFEPKSSPPTLYRGQTAVRVSRPYGEFSTTVRATLAGQQENRRRNSWWAIPPDSTLADGV